MKENDEFYGAESGDETLGLLGTADSTVLGNLEVPLWTPEPIYSDLEENSRQGPSESQEGHRAAGFRPSHPDDITLNTWLMLGSRHPLKNHPRILQAITRLIDARSLRILEQVRDYEKGPTRPPSALTSTLLQVKSTEHRDVFNDESSYKNLHPLARSSLSGLCLRLEELSISHRTSLLGGVLVFPPYAGFLPGGRPCMT